MYAVQHGQDQNLSIPPRKCTMQDMLAKYVSDHQRHWDEHLPLIMMANRSSVHASTQYTPFYLLFGHEVRLPVDVMLGRQPNHKPEVSSYARTPLKKSISMPESIFELPKDQGPQGPLRSANCWRAN